MTLNVSAKMMAALTAATMLTALPACAVQDTGDSADKKEWSIDTANPEGTPTQQIEFETSEGTWISVDVSPDGETILFDLMGHIYEMPVAGGAARALTNGRSWNHLPRYSPNGSEIAFTSDRDGVDNIWVMNRDGGDLENISKSKASVSRATWSADGRHIMAQRYNSDVTSEGLIYNRYGATQDIVKTGGFSFASQFVDDAARGFIYYEHGNGSLPTDGARIYRYNKETGAADIYVQRRGGAFNPHLSPNGKRLAFMGRDDLKTALFVRDVESGRDRMVITDLDRDQMEGLSNYGFGVGMAWASDDTLIMSHQGKIVRLNVNTGAVDNIPFTAQVSREVNETVRFKNPIKTGASRTRIQRFASRAAGGILSEALGDLYLYADGRTRNLTNTDVLEVSPIYNSADKKIYYATWSDTDGGAVYRRGVQNGQPEKLTELATQYGALSLSADGKMLAYLRGPGTLANSTRLEAQTSFELMVRGADGATHKVTDVRANWSFGNTPEIRRASPIMFSADGTSLYFTEFSDNGLQLKTIGLDGRGEKVLYSFPNGTRAVISPDMKWIAFREYQRNFITAFEYLGKPVAVSPADGTGFSKRIDDEDGVYFGWSADSKTLHWTRGTDFYEKSLDDVLAGTEDSADITNIAVEYTVAKPDSLIALTNATVITVDADRRVITGATVLVEDNKIVAIGTDVAVPDGAQVFDATGKYIMPGIVDAHGHYGGDNQSYLHTIEGTLPGLMSPLAHGVTTLYEVYGTAEKDAWVRDRLEAGKTYGSRLFTTGTPIFGSKKFREGLMRPISSLEDARQVLSYNKAFGAEAVKDYAQFTRKARHATATAARELGLQDIAETAAVLQMNMTQIIDGITGLEHSMGMTPLYSDVAKFMAATKVGITPTLIVVYNGPSGETYYHRTERIWEDPKLLKFQTRDELLRFRRPTHFWDDEQYAPKMAAELKPLYEAGVSLQLGAHGQMSGLDAHWEMELYQMGGFSPAQIIEISTINGAWYHGFDDQIGSLEVGKLADLVVLDKNPLEDIKNARAVKWVMQNGVLYSGDDAARIYPNPAPTPPIYFQAK